MKKMAFYVLGFLCFVPTANADIINEFAIIQCNTILNNLKIEMGAVNGAVAEKAFKEKKEEIYKKYGFVIYEDLFEFGPDYAWQAPKEFHESCKLQSTTEGNKKPSTVTYDVTLKGFMENANPNGQCGGWRSFSVTIKEGNKILVKDIPFEEGCNASRALWSIDINPQEEYMTINAAHKMKTDGLVWLNRPFDTITDEMVYPPQQSKADF